jgi:SAM-dependent methyltransferase
MMGVLRAARQRIEANRSLVRQIKAGLRLIGYDATHITRVEPYRHCGDWIEDLLPNQLDVLEVSAGEYWQTKFEFKSYTRFDWPEYDICKDCLERQFDLVIADNVFEHLPYPARAASNVLRMMRPGAWFLNLTPFLIRVHDVPIDCTRWTELGMKYFLEEAGFEPSTMKSGSWGNRAAVKANMRKLGAYRGWTRRLINEREFPVTIWVMAQKAARAG